jgi:hypothetical protein
MIHCHDSTVHIQRKLDEEGASWLSVRKQSLLCCKEKQENRAVRCSAEGAQKQRCLCWLEYPCLTLIKDSVSRLFVHSNFALE